MSGYLESLEGSNDSLSDFDGSQTPMKRLKNGLNNLSIKSPSASGFVGMKQVYTKKLTTTNDDMEMMWS